MSDFIAEARVLVRPDTTRFRAQLQEEINRAISQAVITPVRIPVSIGGAALAGATTATAALAAEQKAAETSTLGLARGLQLENSALGRAATLLPVVTAETQAVAGANLSAAKAAATHGVAQGQVQKAAFASTAGFLGLRGAVLTAGTAFLAATVGFQALAKSLQSAAEFQTELNTFRVTAQATEGEMREVADAARELGTDLTLPGVSAQDAAQGLTELSKAGLSVQESLAGIRGTLQLATAAQISNAEAAELVANALNAFQLEGEDATKVADLLAGASIEAQGSIEDMGLALRQSAAAAALAGLTVEETVTILTQLARAGLSASDAGTSFRVSILRLLKPTKDVEDALARLRVDFTDAAGNIRAEAFGELGAAIANLPPDVQKTTVALLGGADALRTFAILARGGTAEFERIALAIGEQGLASDLASARTAGFAGQVENLKNQASATATTLGTVLAPIAGGVADSLAGAFRAANLAADGIRSLARESGPAAGSISELKSNVEEAQKNLLDYANSAGASEQTTGILRDRLQEAEAALRALAPAVRIAAGELSGFDIAAAGVTGTVGGLIEALNKLRNKALQGIPADEGLTVEQVLNRVTGFDAAEVRARTKGDTAELLAVLEAEQAFLQQQLQRQAVKNRPALKRQLEQALFGVVSDLRSITATGAADAKSAAADAAKAIREADQALLDALGQRREDSQRRISAAGDTEGVRDDIRRQNEFQALIKIQIQKIRARIKDEAARKDAIRALRIALISSRAEEERLRQEQAQDAAAAQQETINLDIAFAETTNNVNREVAARQRLIALLRKQQSHVKKGTIEWKRLRNEIAEQQQAIKEARQQQDDAKKEGKTFAQSAFEFAQSLQGFSANLLGNLIPGFATGGLVGNTSPQAQGPADVGAGVQQAGTLRAAEVRGVRPVQVDTTNQLLRQILAALQGRQTQPPEIRNNRAEGHAMFDIF